MATRVIDPDRKLSSSVVVMQNDHNFDARWAEGGWAGDLMDNASRALRSSIAALLIAAVLFIPSRARADSIAENVDGPWSTGKKVVIGITGVGFVASTGYMIYSLVSWQNARADLAAFPRTPGDTQTADCTNASQCADLRSASDDAKSAKDHLPVATGLMFGFGLATCVLAAVWPNSNTRIAPTASSTGGALTIGGTF